jgi:PadR family transcriptional regulator PadR
MDLRQHLFYCVEIVVKGDYLGEFEQIILVALLRLGRNAYGMAVRREIEERTGRRASIGAVYATLERLEAKRYVGSFAGEPAAERGGRAKRFLHIESDGQRALRDSQETIRKNDGRSENALGIHMKQASPPRAATWPFRTHSAAAG